MSEFMRDAIPIIFMYGCVLALGPFIAVAMWMAFDGDRLREPESQAAEAAPSVDAVQADDDASVTNQLEAREAFGAA